MNEQLIDNVRKVILEHMTCGEYCDCNDARIPVEWRDYPCKKAAIAAIEVIYDSIKSSDILIENKI